MERTRYWGIILLLLTSWVMADTIESVCVIPGLNTTTEDEVWFVVNRTINGATVRYIEQMQPMDWGSDQNDVYMVDAGISYSGADANSFSGASHLEAETITLWGDGRMAGTATVASGAFTTTATYGSLTAGIGYTSIYESMPVILQSQGKTSASMITRIAQLSIDFYETQDVYVGVNSTDKSRVEFMSDSDVTEDLFSGIKHVVFPRGWSRDLTIYMSVDTAAPLTVLGLYPEVEVRQ